MSRGRNPILDNAIANFGNNFFDSFDSGVRLANNRADRARQQQLDEENKKRQTMVLDRQQKQDMLNEEFKRSQLKNTANSLDINRQNLELRQQASDPVERIKDDAVREAVRGGMSIAEAKAQANQIHLEQVRKEAQAREGARAGRQSKNFEQRQVLDQQRSQRNFENQSKMAGLHGEIQGAVGTNDPEQISKIPELLTKYGSATPPPASPNQAPPGTGTLQEQAATYFHSLVAQGKPEEEARQMARQKFPQLSAKPPGM